VDISYTIRDANGNNIAFIPMVPYEEGRFYDDNNTPANSYSGNIGPVPQYSDSPDPGADENGNFHDVPVGSCFYTTFANAGATQAIRIYVGDNNYLVRSTVRFTTNGTGYQHGNISNGSDVSAGW
jgi:hypothetical protein